MFRIKLNERFSAIILALIFLFLSVGAGISMANPLHVSAMVQPKTQQNHSTHLMRNVQNIQNGVPAQQQSRSSSTSHMTKSCAALCQTSTSTNSVVLMPISEKEKDDDKFVLKADENSICPLARNDSEPIFEERELKVPLYLKNCLLRI